MVAILFQDLLKKAVQSNVIISNGRESLKWLSKEARKLSTDSNQLFRDEGITKNELVNWNQLTVGKMYIFYYDSKLFKEGKLKYFDRVPCIFPLGATKTHMIGLNLHYLDYANRAKFLDALYSIENNAKLTKNKKLKLTYGLLKSTASLKYFKPCIKKYLISHIKSRFLRTLKNN